MNWLVLGIVAAILFYLFLVWVIPLPDYLSGHIPPHQYWTWGITMSIVITLCLSVGLLVAILVLLF